ncbi:GGDEF domain-containing protein [Chitinibacter sp. FCG-7]|uniref:GGDEF domain-containing protein n=1 Tax=Chitinibacter mangrovi TaxID=3153927 RepID=A0AAU7FC39_9NEIS
MPSENLPEQQAEQVLSIIQTQALSALFQPIAALSEGQAFGFEGLIRGPEHHPLHSPIQLFQAAERCGLLAELDQACCKTILRAFVERQLPGRLFLNVCPGSLIEADLRAAATLDYLAELGLAPQRIVIELTESQAIRDYALLSRAVAHYRQMGFKIALDDLGEGFSGLRLWSELKPDFVKIDKYFIHGIDQDAQKRQFVRSIQQIALNTHTTVIAEGIETRGELKVVNRTGIKLAQGFLLGRPAVQPDTALKLPRLPLDYSSEQASTTALSLLQEVSAVSPHDSHDVVWQRFRSQPELLALPVVEQNKAIGLIKRNAIFELFARPYSRELFGGRSCSLHMDAQPLIVEHAMSLTELARLMTSCERRQLDDGFIITEEGRYLGMGTGRDLIRAMTELQLAAARHANPLTGLPGNVPIQDAMSQLLAAQHDFTVVYADLDHFKPYNDVYGYARGDELLQCLGQLMQDHFDAGLDFVGHIGGDDFILLLRSPDWQQRCEQLLADFKLRIAAFFNEEDRQSGSYVAPNRQGQLQAHPLVSLSLGAAHIVAKWYKSHHEVASIASSAKSMAKRESGNALFIERRIPNPIETGKVYAAKPISIKSTEQYPKQNNAELNS